MTDFSLSLLTQHFTTVKVNQVADYARRKCWSVEEAERWLAPVLGY